MTSVIVGTTRPELDPPRRRTQEQVWGGTVAIEVETVLLQKTEDLLPQGMGLYIPEIEPDRRSARPAGKVRQYRLLKEPRHNAMR